MISFAELDLPLGSAETLTGQAAVPATTKSKDKYICCWKERISGDSFNCVDMLEILVL
jgi:hypothetical protein